MNANFDPKLIIEYGSWFECIKLSQLPELLLKEEIEKRIIGYTTQLLKVGILNQNKEQVKADALKTMQLEQARNQLRISYLKDKKNDPLNAFEHLISLGEIHDRIMVGLIENLKKIN